VAVAHVQTVVANDNDGGTSLAGPSLTTTAGNLLAVVVYGFDGGAGNPLVTSVTFNSVTNSTPDISQAGTALDSALYIFHFENIAAVTGAVTGVVNANAGWSVFAMEISGCATASALDGAGSKAINTSGSITPAPGVFTASATDGFTLSAFGAEIATGSITGLSSPWVTPTNGTTQSAGREAGVEYQLASPANVNGTWTISSAPWAACQVVYKIASGGGGTTRGIPFGNDSTAFTGGRCFTGILRAPMALKAA
jgi:hypothetical protein